LGTSRRAALIGILAMLSAGFSCLSPRSSGPGRTNGEKNPLDSDAEDPAARELSRDLARLAARPYSEEGIPVFLVCEDIVEKGMTAKDGLTRPFARKEQYARQLEHLGRSFSSVSEHDLDLFLATGRWHKAKPGVICAVYEGYRNGYDVLRPLLEQHGLIGWFFIITGFIEAEPREQLTFAQGHEIDMETHEYSDGRYALSWDELKELDRRHVVACHTRAHRPLDKLPLSEREDEVVGTQRLFEQRLGHPVRSFVSYGGPVYGKDPITDRLITRAGYQFVFSNLRIQRIRPWSA
jgi:hypothetical protein